MPSGVIRSPAGVRESHTWPAGTVTRVVLYSDWEGEQPTPPVVSLRISHTASVVYDAGPVALDHGTGTFVIGSPADCNGCSLTRHDAGAATVAWHTA